MKFGKIVSTFLAAVLSFNISSVGFSAVRAEELAGAEVVGSEVVSCPKQTITDAKTGREYYYMNVGDKVTVKPYVTMQNWNADGTKFLVMTPDDNKMYEYDTVRETLRFLDYASGTTAVNAVVTPDNHIFYIYDKKIYKINWNTYEKTLVCPFPYGCTNLGNIQVTNDGKYMNGYFSGYSGGNTVARINLETGEVDALMKKDFSYNPDTMGVGHPIINPEYPELLFFCHEGTTTLIPDRLWLANTDTREMFNLFEQGERDDGLSGECSGHEVWGMDGEYMYFVKYDVSQNIGQRGLMRVTKDGSEREYINGDFSYWHCYPSSDNNWVVGDTNKGQIAIANTKTHYSELLVHFRIYSHQHPYQPHPVISYSNNAVNWQMVNSANVCGVGWTDISDLTGKKTLGGKSELNSQIDIISYENAISTSSKTVKNGYECISASGGKAVFADIHDSYIKSTNKHLMLTVSYVDAGNQPLSIVYSSGVNSKRDLYKFEDNEILIDKQNTGLNKTVRIDLGYVNANNIGSFRSDLKLSSGSEPVYITDIQVHPCSSEYSRVYERGSYAISGKSMDITKGIYALCPGRVATYTNSMFSVDDSAGCLTAGITSGDIDAAKKAGAKYITKASDGGMMYKTVTDASGITKQTWFTASNYRTDKKVTVGGAVYFSISDSYIKADDDNLILFIEYLDSGTDNMTFRYFSDSGIKNLSMPRTGTGKWKTAVIDISDAEFSADNKGTALATGCEDFLIAANGTDTHISRIAVIRQEDYEYINTAEYIPSDSASQNPTVFLVSDGYAEQAPLSEYPREGWAMETKRYFSPDISFVNMSEKGMTTASFFEGGTKDAITEQAVKGDYIFLQLGSDEDSVEDYKTNLKGIIDYASEAELNLVFLTHARSRVFSENGTVGDDGGDIYRSAMSDVASKHGIPLLDVSSAQAELMNSLGAEASKHMYMYADREFYPDCSYENLSDDTALCRQGAIELCKLVARLIKQYEGTGLKTLSKLAGYVMGDTSPMPLPVCQTVKPSTDITEVTYIIDGLQSAKPRSGNVQVKLKVTNRLQKKTDAQLFAAVYSKDGQLTGVSSSDKVSLDVGESAVLRADEVTLPPEEGYELKKFVWTSSLRPYTDRESDWLGLDVRGYSGRAVLTWEKFSGFPAGSYFRIFRDGLMVGETDSHAFIDENIPAGEHNWQVNAYNSMGIFLYQSNHVLDYVSGERDISDNVFYASPHIDSRGNVTEIVKDMYMWRTNTYYPLIEAQKYYPHVTTTNLLEAYSYKNVPYITDGSDGSVRIKRVTDAAGVVKDAWQTARVYRVMQGGVTAVRDCFMYFGFDDGVITPDDHNVTVYVEYLSDRDSLKIQYANCIIEGENVTVKNESGTRLTNSAWYGEKQTGRWRIAKFELDDAYFNEAGTSFVTGKCDLRICSEGKELTVSSVTVVKGSADSAESELASLANPGSRTEDIREASLIYPSGISFDISSGAEQSVGLYSFRMTDGGAGATAAELQDADGGYSIAHDVSGDSQNYLFFDADDRYLFGASDNVFEIELTYKADFDGYIMFRSPGYDTDKEKITAVSDRVLTTARADGTWKTTVFKIEGAALTDSLAGGCDFALYTPSAESGNQLKIRRLVIRNAGNCN